MKFLMFSLYALLAMVLGIVLYQGHVRKEACLSQGGVFTQKGQCVIFPPSMGVRVR